jgi:hypothetical protein
MDKQEWLVDYLLRNNFNIVNTLELQKKISGMTSTQILDAMKQAKELQQNLASTELGKELL